MGGSLFCFVLARVTNETQHKSSCGRVHFFGGRTWEVVYHGTQKPNLTANPLTYALCRTRLTCRNRRLYWLDYKAWNEASSDDSSSFYQGSWYDTNRSNAMFPFGVLGEIPQEYHKFVLFPQNASLLLHLMTHVTCLLRPCFLVGSYVFCRSEVSNSKTVVISLEGMVRR